MKYVLACAAIVVVLGLLPTAEGRPARIGVPSNPSNAWCKDASQVKGAALLIPGFGEAIAKCMNGHHMRSDVRNCLIATIGFNAGFAVGGVIEMVAARAIAGRMVQAGTAACVAMIVGT